MDADNKYDDGDCFEYVDVYEEQPEQQQSEINNKKKVNNLNDENDDFRSEIEAVKTENKVLLAKMDSLQAQNGELQARLKVVELEAKLASEQMSRSVEVLQKQLSDAVVQMQQNQQQKFNEHQAVMSAKVAALESKSTKYVWNNNRWDICNQKQMHLSVDGLTFTSTKPDDWTMVRAEQPISRAMLVSFLGLKLVYWEVLVKNSRFSSIGWVSSNFSLNEDWFGHDPDSFAIDCYGNYFEPSREIIGYGKEFDVGDIVGTGHTRDGKLFFTQNGQLNGKPIPLEDSQDLLLFPTINLYSKNTSLEANFGADPAKPFKFDIKLHEKQLFKC